MVDIHGCCPSASALLHYHWTIIGAILSGSPLAKLAYMTLAVVWLAICSTIHTHHA